jgi:hypothetical protein
MIKVGFDFDNTIINYDNLFHKISLNKKLINKEVGKTKKEVKDFLIKNYSIGVWKNIQSEVYGKYIHLAKPNKKIIQLIKYLNNNNIEIYIISHKTKFPYVGKKINLHKISLKWINRNVLKKKIKRKNIYFETTERKKISRIKDLRITHFIDDLDKILSILPKTIFKIKYSEDFKFGQIKDKYFHKKNFDLIGGRNNIVNYTRIKNKEFILKIYKDKHSTKYNRCETEYKYLNFLYKKKINNIPNIIKLYPNKKKILFGYIEGKKVKKISNKELDSCINFIHNSNKNLKIDNFNFQLASDACTKLDDHFMCYERRYKQLVKLCKLNSSLISKKTFRLLDLIQKDYILLKNSKNFFLMKNDGKKLINNLILSPSDFGFHNSIVKNNRLIFLDFEYSGWDDPIKFLCDFILNPDYHISSTQEVYFVNRFKNFFPKLNIEKYYFLKQVHFLKWICVILGYIYKENSLNSEYLYKAFTYYQTLKKRHLINNIRYNN